MRDGVNNRYSTGFQGLEVGHNKYKQHVPEKHQSQPPPNYNQAIPIGKKYRFNVPSNREEPVEREEDGIAEMQLSSSDRILICDRTGGAKTSLLKRIVFGLWKGGQKIIHLTDVKNDFANIDKEGGIPPEFVDAAGLHPGESPGSIPVQVFQPRLLYNEYRRTPPDVLDGMETFAYGFQDLRESEIKTLVNATSDTQTDILTNAIAAHNELTYSALEETVLSMDANPQAKRSLMNSVRRLKEQEVLHDSYREKLPADSLDDGVVAVSMDNWDSFKREGREKLEIQIAIALRRIKHRLRDGELKGPVTPIFDEAHVFCSENNDISTPEIVDMIDLGRAYDIPMIFSSQRASQLDQEIIDGLSHFFIGKNVPPDQRMDLLKAADLVNHEDYSTGKWTKIFREMGKYEFLQVDSERSLWRVVSPFAPPCFHPWEDDD